MKNIKKILIPIVVLIVLCLSVFGIISVNNKPSTTPTFTIEQQKQLIEEDLLKNKDYTDSFKQTEYEKYKETYATSYTKVKTGGLKDVGNIVEFKQLSPISKISSDDSFKNISYFEDKSIADYDFYTFTMSFFSTSFPEGDIDLAVKGPNEAVAFLGSEYKQFPQNAQPHRYYPVVVVLKKGDNIADYKLTVKDVEITQSYAEEKTSGELKIGDSFKYQLSDKIILHGTVMDIKYMKTDYGSGSPNSSLVYKGSIAQAYIMYSIEGGDLKAPTFGNENVVTMLKTYIASKYKTIGFDIGALDYKSDVIIKPYYDMSMLGSFTTNGTFALAAEAYIKEALWNKGSDSVGFDKDTVIHFGDFSVNLKAQ